MNKLIAGAHCSSKAAKEQRLRGELQGHHSICEPTNIQDYSKAWERAADGLERHDPQGIELSRMFQSIEKDKQRHT